MVKYKNTEDDYRKAVANATSIAGVCRELGIVARGGNYETVKRKIAECDLDISHFLGHGWNKGNFSDNPNKRSTIRKKIIRERGHRCEECGLEEWFGKPVAVEMEHIDGNNQNNAENNLKILCLLCHANTETWKRKKSSLLPNPAIICPSCDGTKQARSKTCAKCRPRKIPAAKFCKCGSEINRTSKACLGCRSEENEIIIWPSTDTLITRLSQESYLQVAKSLGVSDNAIRNRLRVRGIDPKTLQKLT